MYETEARRQCLYWNMSLHKHKAKQKMYSIHLCNYCICTNITNVWDRSKKVLFALELRMHKQNFSSLFRILCFTRLEYQPASSVQKNSSSRIIFRHKLQLNCRTWKENVGNKTQITVRRHSFIARAAMTLQHTMCRRRQI